MCSGKWFVTGLLLGLVFTLTASTIDDSGEINEKTAWVGDQVDLECGDSRPISAHRFWKKGNDAVAVCHFDLIIDDRIHPVNSSAILRIVNVTVEDKGQYTCIVQTPAYKHIIGLHVKEASCEAPKIPLNGGYVNQSLSVKGFKFEDKIRYYCDSGFQLIGEEFSTCSGSHKGWTAEEPHCEPRYISELKRRLDTIEDKISTIDSNWTLMVMWLSASIGKPLPPSYTKFINSMRNRLEKEVEIGTLTQRDGSTVSEFTWIVKNIEEEINESDKNKSYAIISPSFYTNIPGYRVYVKLMPNRTPTSLGISLGLVEGEFDSLMSWPFNKKYEIVSVGGDGSAMDHLTVESSAPDTALACSMVFVQPPNNSRACGTPDFIEREKLLFNKDQYLIDGSLKIKITVWISD